MSPSRILGIVLSVVGVIFFVLGVGATDSIGESISEGVTGNYTDKTTWYIVGGAVAAVVGAGLAMFGDRRSRSA